VPFGAVKVYSGSLKVYFERSKVSLGGAKVPFGTVRVPLGSSKVAFGSFKVPLGTAKVHFEGVKMSPKTIKMETGLRNGVLLVNFLEGLRVYKSCLPKIHHIHCRSCNFFFA
jgi:hypothetical protein